MMNKPSNLLEKQKEIYSFYNDRLRWVIIFIESRYKKFPVPILNEIRAVQDHMARCFEDENADNEEYINEQLRAAKGHYLRCLLDGYKYIWYQYCPEIKKKYFWAKIFGDLHSIDNGEFVKQMDQLRCDAKRFNFEARRIESKNKDMSLDLYEKSIGKLVELEELFDNHAGEIGWSVKKGMTMKVIAGLGWMIALVFTIHRNWDEIIVILKSLF